MSTVRRRKTPFEVSTKASNAAGGPSARARPNSNAKPSNIEDDLEGNYAQEDDLDIVNSDESDSEVELMTPSAAYQVDSDSDSDDSNEHEGSDDDEEAKSKQITKRVKAENVESKPSKSTQKQAKQTKEVTLSKGAQKLLRVDYYNTEDDEDQDAVAHSDETKDGTDLPVSVKNFFEALGVFATQHPTVQARLLLQLIKFHDLETAGMGKKSAEFSHRVTEVPELTHHERKDITKIAENVITNRQFPLQDPNSHNLSKLMRIVSASLGKYTKQKLSMDVNSVIGSPHKLELGSPYIVVVVPSTDRLYEIAEVLTKLSTKKRVVKLFAHGNNLKEQVQELRSDVRIAVGTPARLLKLVQMGALKLQRCELFIVDCARDVKTLNILTMNQVRDDFCELWARNIQMELGQTRGNKHVPATCKVLFI